MGTMEHDYLERFHVGLDEGDAPSSCAQVSKKSNDLGSTHGSDPCKPDISKRSALRGRADDDLSDIDLNGLADGECDRLGDSIG